ncbi:methyltransferase domain-containing protein [Actinoalloteichus caeruleus]|uniref:methyltransferase domain-containing protein n=1 Tax=Actinoalloteichus cyanogriseus TaxID=2893586 RepID=UPI003AB01E1F
MSNATADYRRLLRSQLAEILRTGGSLADPALLAAFTDVPRDHFVDDFAVHTPDGLSWISRDDPARLSYIHSDTTLITEIDSHGTPISSSTAPSLMATMLEALELRGSERVLEIGTGTGYNAALLCHRLGSHRVVTVDIEPGLTLTAAARLDDLGYQPTVLTGDGAEGAPRHGPFDRLITTCGLTSVPATWLRQVRPGGRILVNLGFGLVSLLVLEDGTAEGGVLDFAAFMPRRTSVDDPASGPHDIPRNSGRPARRDTLPEALDDRTGRALLSLHRPGLWRGSCLDDDGRVVHLLRERPTGAWVRATELDDGSVEVFQSGLLWDSVIATLREWEELGRPDITAYRVRADAQGHHVLAP